MFRRFKPSRGVLILSGVGTAIGLGVLLKDSFGGDDYYGDEKITGKTVIITGANTGLGKQLSKELANRGGRIIMACRDMEKCDKVRKEIMEITFNRNVECKKLDLSSMKSIREFSEDINTTEPRLDVLVNNAGVMAPPFTLTEDGFELQLAVNYLGPFLLTHLLLDKLKLSKPSRIVNAGSVAYVKGKINFKDLNNTKHYDGSDSYAQSKLALMMFNRELATRLEGSGVSTYAAYPGLVKTDIGRHMSLSTSTFSKLILNPVLWFIMLTPRQGVQTYLHCILSPDAEGVSGKYWVHGEERRLEEDLMEKEVAQRLWLVSKHWTRLDT